MIKSFYDKVIEFHLSFNIRAYDMLSFVPTDILDLRAKLIIEEEKEYNEAAIAENKLEILDAICDLLYVNCGMAHVTSLGVRPTKTISKVPINQNISKAVDDIIEQLQAPIPCQKVLPGFIDTLNGELIGIAAFNNFKLEPAFAEVHRANMTKLWTTEQRSNLPVGATAIMANKPGFYWIVKNAAGKVIKPPGWKAPDLKPYV